MTERKTTFKEAAVSAESKQQIICALREEGFTEEQLNEMTWERVWKLYVDSFQELFSRELGATCTLMEKNPQSIPALEPHIEELCRTLKDLEKWAEDSLRKQEEKERKKEGSE